MVELVEGKEYKLISLIHKDPYNDMQMEGEIVTIVEIGSAHLLIKMSEGNIRTIQKGAVLEELPPIENEAATMEMMGFSDKEVTSYMKESKVGFYESDLTTAGKIIATCDAVKELLLSKNKKYGDSALSSGIAFDISPVVAIKARINDKLARLKNDNKDEDEDIISDLLGYFILLKIAKENER
jgi:hypothetical protein